MGGKPCKGLWELGLSPALGAMLHSWGVGRGQVTGWGVLSYLLWGSRVEFFLKFEVVSLTFGVIEANGTLCHFGAYSPIHDTE